MNFKIFSVNSILTPEDKKQRLMLVILVATVLISVVILYFGFWRSPTPTPTPTSPSLSEEPSSVEFVVTEEKNAAPSVVIKKMNFDTDFLENPYLRNLKIYGEWPLQVDEKGRANPFLPY
ncbi:hypothetical protein KKG85_00450 [Patescibacteria group bacterium]|nr:hypothetical protein [Patescibacteria group bacterium]MBU2579540.1 hypothetical protein [Patescibacteria group bacterium]